jgi:hypothetical protein
MGPLLFGGFQLVRGVLYYLTVPSGARKATHFATLGGLIAVGILSAGFVGVSEAQAAQETAAGTHEYSLLSATSPTSAFEALDKRWKARLDGEAALSDRFEAQEKTAP